MFLSDVEGNLRSAAGNLLALAAGAETTVQKMEATDPLVGAAIQLAEHEVPGLTQVVGIAQLVLQAAQAVVTATQAAVPAPAAAAPSVAGAAS